MSLELRLFVWCWVFPMGKEEEEGAALGTFVILFISMIYGILPYITHNLWVINFISRWQLYACWRFVSFSSLISTWFQVLSFWLYADWSHRWMWLSLFGDGHGHLAITSFIKTFGPDFQEETLILNPKLLNNTDWVSRDRRWN